MPLHGQAPLSSSTPSLFFFLFEFWAFRVSPVAARAALYHDTSFLLPLLSLTSIPRRLRVYLMAK